MTIIKVAKKVAIFGLLSLLMGCADYQAYNFGSGYKDMALGNNQYLVEYYSDHYVDKPTNKKNALRRAAEVTKERGYRYFEIISETDTSTQETTPVRITTERTTDQQYPTDRRIYNEKSTTTLHGGEATHYPGISLLIRLIRQKTPSSYDADIILSNYVANRN